MFRAGLLFIIRRYYSVYSIEQLLYVVRLCWLVVGKIGIGSYQQPVSINAWYTNCCIYSEVPPDGEQRACSKHVEVNYWNKLKVNSASNWVLLYGYLDEFHANAIRTNTHACYVFSVLMHDHHHHTDTLEQ